LCPSTIVKIGRTSPDNGSLDAKSVDRLSVVRYDFELFYQVLMSAQGQPMSLQVLTPANQLTILRMIFIPIFVILLVYDQRGWAFAIFILAGVTDVLDGLIARWFQQKTSLGAYLDPIADKLLLTTSFVVLSIKEMELPNLVPLWLTILVISRDVILISSVLIIVISTGHRTFPPSVYGKAATCFQILTIVAVLYWNYRGVNLPPLHWLFVSTAGITVYSGLDYIYRGKRMVSETAALEQ
jgi:cardiolipin synthase (CMP-forming)